MKKIFSTACPRNCYSTCSFKVHVENNRIINIDPHPDNKSTPEGICLKGLSYVERAHSKDRILFPLKRNLRGGFDRVSWDDAIQEISGKLKEYKNEFGPKSVLYYAASGMAGYVNELSEKFWELYGGATTMFGNLCWPAGLEAIHLTLGDNKHNVPWDIENAKLIILWGKNPAETNIQQMIFIEKAQQKGAKLIVIDPRRTPSSERADLLIQPKPGTDAALALGIAHLLFENNQIDKSFVDQYVLGFDKFVESISMYTPEKVTEITDVPVDFIKELANDVGKIKPMTLVPGYGMQRFANGGQTIRSLLALNVLTANIGKPGACFHYANLQSYVFDVLKEPMSYYPEMNSNPKFRRSVSMALLGEDMLLQKNPELKMIWVERGNPVTQNPDTNTVLKAFRKLDFRVVVEQFLTDTAKEADIILPAKNMFEQTDIIGSYWNPYVQLKPKVVEPAGEVKPESEIYYLLAQKLGYSNSEIEKYLPVPGNENIETHLKEKLKTFPELSWDSLKERPAIAPGNEEVAYSNLKFNTPSGKIELRSEVANKKWGVNELPTYEDPYKGEKDMYPLKLLSPNTKNRIHSQFGNLDVIRQFDPEPYAVVSIRDANERRIIEGDRIKIYNDRGELTTKAKLDFSLKKGCVVYYNGLWLQEGGTSNLLSKGRETDMGHGTAFHDCCVEVERIKDNPSQVFVKGGINE
ncbi:MAG: molybdopterin-dependent oxidoreductase [Bacteroidales bacterium]|nr:molybdopterin-dependent oxidoreductase [Bacteroidales bacterium]MCF8405265.1 molybdopterin-dependent oxidoreductase [Bacteroidales bacterium]